MAQEEYGMFGPAPWQVAEMQKRQGMQDDMRYAQMDPMQGSVFMSAQAGRNLGGAITGTARQLGVPVAGNEAMEQAEKMQAINRELQNSGINPTDTEKYLTALGEKLASAGLTNEAMKVGQALQSFRDKQASLDTKKYDAETARIKAEAFKTSKLRSPVAQAIFAKNKEYTPESLEAYRKSITDENIDGDISTLRPYQEPKDFKEIGTTDSGNFVFDDGKGQPVVRVNGQLTPYDPNIHGKAAGKGTKVDVRVGAPQIKVENVDRRPAEDVVGAEAMKVLGADAKESLMDLRNKATMATTMMPEVAKMKELAQSGNLITGSAAEQRTALARIAVTLNPNSPLAKKVNDSDFFDRFAIEMVMPKMKQLGGNDSNEELAKMQKAVENRTLTPEQIMRGLDFLESKNKKIINGYNEFLTGRQKGRNDPTQFDYVNYRWMGPTVREDNQVGTTSQTVEEKNARAKPAPLGPPPVTQREAYTTPVVASPPVKTVDAPPPPVMVAPVNNPKFNDAVERFMRDKGVSREEAINKLLAAKAAQGR